MVICSFDLNCTLLDNASRKIWPFGMTQVQELKLSCLFHFRFPASLCCLLVKCLAICERHLTIVCTQNVVGDEFISRLSTFLLDLVWTFCGLSKALSVSVLHYFGTMLDFTKPQAITIFYCQHNSYEICQQDLLTLVLFNSIRDPVPTVWPFCVEFVC
jgi:hypothetical protein